jgi:hypothetical protein
LIDAFAVALRALPTATFTGAYDGRSYVVSKSAFNKGASIKLVAEERGGNDYISLNFYDLKSGPRLKPCEMPSFKVIDFVLKLVPDIP